MCAFTSPIPWKNLTEIWNWSSQGWMLQISWQCSVAIFALIISAAKDWYSISHWRASLSRHLVKRCWKMCWSFSLPHPRSALEPDVIFLPDCIFMNFGESSAVFLVFISNRLVSVLLSNIFTCLEYRLSCFELLVYGIPCDKRRLATIDVEQVLSRFAVLISWFEKHLKSNRFNHEIEFVISCSMYRIFFRSSFYK